MGFAAGLPAQAGAGRNERGIRPFQGWLFVDHFPGGVAPGYCLVPLQGTRIVSPYLPELTGIITQTARPVTPLSCRGLAEISGLC
jgi:hypothetical protein